MDPKKIIIWLVTLGVAAGIGYFVTRPAGAVRQNVDNAAAQELIASGVRIVDVRTAEEFAAGHIPGAENVPIDSLPGTAGGWDRDGAVLLYCATGARSANGAEWMAANGFRKVYNLEAGIAAWDGQTTTEGTGGTGRVATNGKPVFIEFSSSG